MIRNSRCSAPLRCLCLAPHLHSQSHRRRRSRQWHDAAKRDRRRRSSAITGKQHWRGRREEGDEDEEEGDGEDAEEQWPRRRCVSLVHVVCVSCALVWLVALAVSAVVLVGDDASALRSGMWLDVSVAPLGNIAAKRRNVEQNLPQGAQLFLWQ